MESHETNDAGAALAAFSRDVERLQNRFAASGQTYAGLPDADRGSFWEKVMEDAKALRERWRGNPFIEIQGFSVSLSWLPGIDVRFAFKDDSRQPPPHA